jgi:hypothetical protein
VEGAVAGAAEEAEVAGSGGAEAGGASDAYIIPFLPLTQDCSSEWKLPL